MPEINYKNKLIVKSNNLIESKYHLSVREQKFIIFLASLVDRKTTHLKQTKVKIKEIEMALKGTNDKKWGSIYEVVREVVLSINSKPLSIQKPNGGWIIINWFSMVDADATQGVITFELSDRIKEQLLKLNEYFTRYRFGNILALKSSYSIRIYELLKLNQYRGSARYELGHFRQLIGASYLNQKKQWVHKYEEYKILKNRIIKHSQRELKEKTDIYFEFKEEREGRKVKYLIFYMFKNDPEQTPAQQELFSGPSPGSEIDDEHYLYNTDVIDAFKAIGLPDEKSKSIYREGFNIISDNEIRKNIVKNGRSLDEYLMEKVDYIRFKIQSGEAANPIGLLLSAIKHNYISKEIVLDKKAKAAREERLAAERKKASKEAELHEMRQALHEKEMKIINKLINSEKDFLDQLLQNKQPEFWTGFDLSKNYRQNFDESPVVRSRIINLLKADYAAQFACLQPESLEVKKFARRIARL